MTRQSPLYLFLFFILLPVFEPTLSRVITEEVDSFFGGEKKLVNALLIWVFEWEVVFEVEVCKP